MFPSRRVSAKPLIGIKSRPGGILHFSVFISGYA